MIPGLCSLLYVGTGSSGGFSAIATPTLTVTSGTGLKNSSNFTATPSGGTGPYTYQWNYVMGDPEITIINPTSATTAHARAFISSGDSLQGFITCTVTDSASHVTTSNQITVQFTS